MNHIPSFEDYKKSFRLYEALEKDKLTLSEMTIANLKQNTANKDSGVFGKANKVEIEESFKRYNTLLGNVYKDDVNIYSLFGAYLRYVYTTIGGIYNPDNIEKLIKPKDKTPAFFNVDFLRFHDSTGNVINKDGVEVIRKYLMVIKKTSLKIESIIAEQNVNSFLSKYGTINKIILPNLLKNGNIDDIFDFIVFTKNTVTTDNTIPQLTDFLKQSNDFSSVMDSLFSEYGGLQKFFNSFFKEMSGIMEYKVFSSESNDFSVFGKTVTSNIFGYSKKKFATLTNILPTDIENKKTKNMLENFLKVSYFLKYMEAYLYHYTKKQFSDFTIGDIPVEKTNLKASDPVVKSAEKYVANTPTKTITPEQANVTGVGTGSKTSKKSVQKYQGIFGGSTGTKDLKESRESSQEVANMQATLLLCVMVLTKADDIDKFLKAQNDSRFTEEIGKVRMMNMDDFDQKTSTLKIKSKLNDGIFGFRTKKLLLLFKQEYNQNAIFAKNEKISKPDSHIFDEETRKALNLAKDVVSGILISTFGSRKNLTGDNPAHIDIENSEIVKNVVDKLDVKQGDTISAISKKVDDYNKEAKTGGEEK